MAARDDLVTFQRRLAEALVADDPGALAARPLPGALAAAAGYVDHDGFAIAALLVLRLRFERLLHGSRAAAAWFERNEAEFARAFQRYHREVPPVAHEPRGEARAFEAWCARQAADC